MILSLCQLFAILQLLIFFFSVFAHQNRKKSYRNGKCNKKIRCTTARESSSNCFL